MGLFPEETFVTHTFSLEAETSYIVYTDGIFEALDGSGQEIGQTAVLDSLLRHSSLPMDACLHETVSDIRNLIHPRGFDDDICLAGVMWRDEEARVPPAAET